MARKKTPPEYGLSPYNPSVSVRAASRIPEPQHRGVQCGVVRG